MFDLVGPCKDCPFRNDKAHQRGWLGERRAQGIYDGLKEGSTFICHKTLEHSDDDYDEETGEYRPHYSAKNQFCAGALILIEKTGDADHSQAIQVAERLGLYDKSKLKIQDSPVFDTGEEFVEWHTNRRTL